MTRPQDATTTRSLASAAGIIAVITLAARIVGFGRWFAFSHAVGATCVGSVYQSVNAVPNVLYEIAAGGVLAAIVVPLVASALARGDSAHADATASTLLTWALLLLVPLGALVALTARPIAAALLGTGCAGEVGLGAQLLVIFAVQVPLYGVGIVLAGVLQSHRRFVGAALTPLLSSVVVIVAYLAYRSLVRDPAADIAAIPQDAVLVLGIGTTMGVAALSLPLLLPLRRAGVRLRPRLRFPDGVGRRVRSLALAGLAVVAGQQLAMLVVIRLANDRGGAGTLNVYTYAQAMMLLPYAVLAVPLATAAFPSLAGAHATEAAEEGPLPPAPAVRTLRRAWLSTLVVSIFGAALLVAVADPVGAFFLHLDAGSRSAASAQTLAAMADAVTLFAPSVVALSVVGLMTRAAYVRGRAVVAGAAAGLGWLGTAAIPLVVLDSAGVGGPTALRVLSAGASLGLLGGALLVVVVVGRSWGWRALRVPTRPVAGALLGAVAAAGLARAAGSWLAARGVGASLGGSLVFGLVLAAGALVVMVGLAAVVDPTLVRRLRSVRSAGGDAMPEGAGPRSEGEAQA